jgi:hypothetical protein
VFEDRKARKKLEESHAAAMAEGLPALIAAVQADTDNVIAGNEVMVGSDPALITGPAGVQAGEWETVSWGGLVLTSTRLNFRRLDGDRVRVAFVGDLTFESTSGPFDTYKWQDKAQLRMISFGFLKNSTLRSELRGRTRS